MGELESIRDIARRLVAEWRGKKVAPPSQMFYPSLSSEPPKATSVAVADPMFNGLDREWLRKLRIEA